MPRVYELPTHLQVEDTLAFGLTPRQLLRLLVGASLAYAVWDQTAILPLPLRLALVTGLGLVGLVLALLQPGGRPLDQWLLAALVFVLLPRRLVWRLDRPDPRPSRTAKVRGWAEVAPELDWLGPDIGATPTVDELPRRPIGRGRGRLRS